MGNGDRAETYTGGLKYDANNIYLAAQYTQTYNATRVGSLGWANKAQNFEAVAQYQFDFGLRPSVAYLQSKGKNLGVINGRNYDDEDILKYVDVGATYYFNKNMSTYVDYKINLLDDNRFTRDAGINTDDISSSGSGLPVLISIDIEQRACGPFFHCFQRTNTVFWCTLATVRMRIITYGNKLYPRGTAGCRALLCWLRSKTTTRQNPRY
ncbi:hypothetical protein EIMP300_38790 [Escherichia coli]|uniref:Uncharacterized protein n=1 Tax=Escherichia coli TaxID=562 RepID=A0A8S0FRY6_ECOLX|nr:hypothetical protein EIMP300_38790 [Escherichia coli]